MRKITILATTVAIGGFTAIHLADAAAYTFTQIDVPGAVTTGAAGINDAGEIVGSFFSDNDHGFLYRGGNFTQIDVPGERNTGASGINGAGQIVGSFNNQPPPVVVPSHGFLDTGGSLTQIDVPGATDTTAGGINNAGQIVGSFNSGTHGFLDTGGSFTQIDPPGATLTQAFGINDAGQIVGDFENSTGVHGFLATPVSAVPEPGILTLLGIGLAGLGVVRRRAIKPH